MTVSTVVAITKVRGSDPALAEDISVSIRKLPFLDPNRLVN